MTHHLNSRNLRWNFIAALVDAAGWGLGFGFVSAATFLPLFVRELTRAPWAIGLIPTILAFGWYVPGILVAHRFERLATVRKVVLWIAFVERLPLLLMVPLILALGPARPALLLGAFFACWAVMSMALGFNSPAYYTLIAKTIPARARGRLYGIGGALAGGLGVVAGELGGQWLTQFGFPTGYALCFAAAFVIQTATVLPLGFMREPVTTNDQRRTTNDHPGFPPTEIAKARRKRKRERSGNKLWDRAAGETPSARPFLSRFFLRAFASFALSRSPSEGVESSASVVRRWATLLKADRNLMWLIASHVLYSGNLMASAFYTDYAVRHLGATPRDVGHFTSALMASQVVSNLLCGLVGDRSGNRRALQLSSAAGVAAAALAPLAPTVTWFYAIFALHQVAATGWGIASMNFVLELCPPERAPTYTAISTVFSGPFRAAMPMVGAALVPQLGYAPVFALSAALTALSLLALTARVVEPRDRRPMPVERPAAEVAFAAAEGAE